MTETKSTARRAVEKTSETIEKGMHQGQERIASLMDFNSAFLDAFARASRNYIESMTAINEEVLNFASERLSETARMRDDLLQCRDISDALRVHQDWLRSASERYMSEASKLIDISAKAAFSAVNPIVEQAKTAMSDEHQYAHVA